MECEGGVYHVINRGNYRQDLSTSEGCTGFSKSAYSKPYGWKAANWLK